MNALTSFQAADGAVLRTIDVEGEPWFVAKDACDALALSTNNVRRMLEDDEVNSLSGSGMRGRATLVISESGLYRLMMRSDKPQARPFQRWVTREVLPAIRKRGAYMTQAVVGAVIEDPTVALRPEGGRAGEPQAPDRAAHLQRAETHDV